VYECVYFGFLTSAECVYQKKRYSRARNKENQMSDKGKTILFVCTGNTCRSPMAERIAKRWLAGELKCKESELESKGIRVASGGISNKPDASDDEARKNGSNSHGSPASAHCIQVMEKRGIDVSDHKSTVLTKSDIGKAFRIYCVSKSHKEKILKYSTAKADSVVTLGDDIPDPFGGSIDDYEQCALTIEKVVPAALQRDVKLFSSSDGAPKLPAPSIDVSGFKKSCGRVRPKETAKEEEKKLYNASMMSADTAYCHHLAEDGRHICLHKLPSSAARKCKGVLYLGITWTGKQIKCGDARGADVVKAGHDPCTAAVCPYMRDYGECPYMKLK
jgi:protein-tyrosine-phosphatase